MTRIDRAILVGLTTITMMMAAIPIQPVRLYCARDAMTIGCTPTPEETP